MGESSWACKWIIGGSYLVKLILISLLLADRKSSQPIPNFSALTAKRRTQVGNKEGSTWHKWIAVITSVHCWFCSLPQALHAAYITHPFHYPSTFSVMTTQVAVDANYWVREGDKLAWSMRGLWLTSQLQGQTATLWWGKCCPYDFYCHYKRSITSNSLCWLAI